ncbi:MAG: 6-phosphogluconolactonase [Aestuariivita sp.]|nr:6-phosphogluconolactonase [Aestuariivita sp.]
MILKKYSNRQVLVTNLATFLISELEAHLRQNDQVSFVVPGGTTPRPVFEHLHSANLDWQRINVFLTDERWVPINNPRSNAGMIGQYFLKNKAARANFFAYYNCTQSINEAVDFTTKKLTPMLPITVLLMGMGVDGHVASLFPGTAELATALAPDAPVLLPQRPQTESEVRVSLSARTLNSALSKHLLIFGDLKRQVLEQAIDFDQKEMPVNAVLSNTTVHWAP